MGFRVTSAVQFVRKLRGGSQPVLICADDGHSYVLKFLDNLQGPNVPFNEAAGAELYRALGLPTPPWTRIKISDAFLNENPDCWIKTETGSQRPRSGLCFASRYISGIEQSMFNPLPGGYLSRVQEREHFWLAWLTDVCAQHTDNRQALFLQIQDRSLQAVYIDYGHMFNGPKGEQVAHSFACRYLDSRIYRSISSDQIRNVTRRLFALDVDALWQMIQTLPEEWQTRSATQSFQACLDRFSSASLLQNMFDMMWATYIQNEEHIHVEKSYEVASGASVLRSGLPFNHAGLCPSCHRIGCSTCRQPQ